MSFKSLNLDSRLVKSLSLLKYQTPTPIQTMAIPQILADHDVVASAQTGTGKTAAFVLPALQKLLNIKERQHPFVLILTPTRELARQINLNIQQYAKFIPLRKVNLMGGMAYKEQMRLLSGRLDIVVATPGRLMDHMEKGRINLSQVGMFILDEADRMLDMGFIDDIKHIAKSLPKNRQTLLFSATINRRLDHIIKQLLKNPTYINLAPEKIAPPDITQKIYLADDFQHKLELLFNLITKEQIYKAIIFSGTKVNADKLARALSQKGLKAAALHGDLRQNKRNFVVEQLHRGKIQLLVATDVAARGIDVQDISHVINFDLPRFFEDYVHRIGRTGRAGKKGIAFSLCLPNEMIHVKRIERYINQTIPRESIPGLEPKANHEKANQSPRKNKDRKRTKGKGKPKSNASSKKISRVKVHDKKPKHKSWQKTKRVA